MSILPDSLALLALQSALQIDRHLKGREFDRDVIVRFGNELSDASGVSRDPQAAYLAADPTAAEIFSDAIEETSKGAVDTVDDVASFTKSIVRSMTGAPESLPKAELARIKTFSLALHKSMMAQQLPPLGERENTADVELRFA